VIRHGCTVNCVSDSVVHLGCVLQPQYEALDDDSEDSEAPSTSTLTFEFYLSEAELRPFVLALLHRLRALRLSMARSQPVPTTVSPEGPAINSDGMHTLALQARLLALFTCDTPVESQSRVLGSCSLRVNDSR